MKPSRPYLNKITAQLDWRSTASCTKKLKRLSSVQRFFFERSPSVIFLRSFNGESLDLISDRDFDEFRLTTQLHAQLFRPSRNANVIYFSESICSRPAIFTSLLSPRDGSRATLFCRSSNFAPRFVVVF